MSQQRHFKDDRPSNPVININPMNQITAKETIGGNEEETTHPDHVHTCCLCDLIFDFCALPFFWYIGIVWLLCVIISGAILVLMMIPHVCTFNTVKECQTFSNNNIQFLLGCFTAINLYGFPVRCARTYSVLTNFGSPGIDFRGNLVPIPKRPRTLLEESYDPSSFYHLSWKTKMIVSVFSVASAVFQFVNQIVRGIYWRYATANTFPGTLWCNLFFVLSFATMIVAGGFEGSEDGKLRKEFPDEFPPIAPQWIEAKVKEWWGAKGANVESSGKV